MANSKASVDLPYGYGFSATRRENARMWGKRLKQSRESRGITLEQLSEAVGISVSQLSRFESENRDPRITEMIAMAAFYGVKVGDLIGETDAGPIDWPSIDELRRALLAEQVSAPQLPYDTEEDVRTLLSLGFQNRVVTSNLLRQLAQLPQGKDEIPATGPAKDD